MAFRFALILLLLPPGICAQQRAPFAGCPADGQAGPIAPPAGQGPIVKDSSLAYYKAAVGYPVLAPKGWYCFAVYGSGGDVLLVSPRPIQGKEPLTGAAIVLTRYDGGASGRFSVAEIIARVFPAHREFVKRVFDDFPEMPKPTPGPYSTDQLTRKSNRIVEFRTRSRSEGLGVQRQWLKADDNPIDGVAILIAREGTENAVLLSVRLPANLRQLAPTVIHQAEQDAAN